MQELIFVIIGNTVMLVTILINDSSVIYCLIVLVFFFNKLNVITHVFVCIYKDVLY